MHFPTNVYRRLNAQLIYCLLTTPLSCNPSIRDIGRLLFLNNISTDNNNLILSDIVGFNAVFSVMLDSPLSFL